MFLRLLSLFCLLAVSGFFGNLQAQTGTLVGRVTDSKTQEPLVGATLRIEGTNLGAFTDTAGYYRIANVPPQTYNVGVEYIGYLPLTKYNVIVRSEGNPDLNFSLEENTLELDEIVIAPNPFEKIEETPLSIQSLSQEEIATYPGGNNDIAKVVQSFPGVSGSVGGFRNDVIIRGGAPNENVYYLDGVEIPNINHFATQGSAGGPVGLLNVSFFEGVQLTTSAFGAQYDNTLSGVLQFDQRNGNARNFNGNVRVGASETALTLEGPLFKGERERARTTFIVSARRSYLQLLFDVLGLPFLPDYWDYQYKVNHSLDDYNDILITGVGSIDDLAINALDEGEADAAQRATQAQIPVIQQRTNTAGITWRRRFKDNSGAMQTTLSTNVLRNEFSNYEDNVNRTGRFFTNDSREQETKLRFRLSKFVGEWTLAGGFVVQNADYFNRTENLIDNSNYETNLNFFRYGLHGQASRRFVQNRLGVSFGLRADGNSFTESGNEMYRTISPRASLSYRIDPSGLWTANFSTGRYYKIAPYTVLGFRDNDGVAVNRDVEYIQSDHLVLGIEHLLSESARITVEGFAKFYDNYPVSERDSVSLANQGGGFEVLGNEPVASAGRGRTYGVEFLFQQKFTRNVYAIASYTFYVSEFTGFDRDEFIPSLWDNRHLVSLLGGWKLKGNWEVSGRYRFLGPTPFAPVDVAATTLAYPAIIRDPRRLGEAQLSAFSQLDLRVDKKFNFKSFSLDLFFDVQNVLSTPTPQEPLYGLDGETPPTLQIVETEEAGQVLPSLGVVLNF